MTQVDQLSYLLHSMKGREPYSKTYRHLVWGSKKWCPFSHGPLIEPDCYRGNLAIRNLIESTDEYVDCCRYLDVEKRAVDEMKEILRILKSPETVGDYKGFKAMIIQLRDAIASVEDDISDKISRLSCLECMRLDEALVCYENYCFHASIVMAVSAVETRIHEMIKRADKKLYLSKFAKATLGQLVQVFDEDHFKDKKFERIKKLVPNKHKPLLALLNEYRVFSAHPKEESMTAQIAESVLHLSFAFLMDPNTCPYEKSELVCA